MFDVTADKFSELKRLLVTTKDFNEIQTYFQDHFGEKPEFMDFGHQIPGETYYRILGATLGRILKRDAIVLKGALFILIPEQHMVHGCAMAGKYMVNTLHFTDIDMGLITVCALGSARVDYARFSITKPKLLERPN